MANNYDAVMGVYNNLVKKGLKKEADAVMSDISKNYSEKNPAPQEVIRKGLEGILAKHQTSGKGASKPVGKMYYAAGLASVLLAVASLSIGFPYAPLPLH